MNTTLIDKLTTLLNDIQKQISYCLDDNNDWTKESHSKKKMTMMTEKRNIIFEELYFLKNNKYYSKYYNPATLKPLYKKFRDSFLP